MKEIPGTERLRFDMRLSDVHVQGDILTTGDAHPVIIEKRELDRPFSFLYTVSVLLGGEELQIALKHYELLKKYNLV